MISANNPFGKEIDIEDNIAVKCDNCGHFTVLKYYYDKDLNIERETAKIKHDYKNNSRVQNQCDLIPEIYNMYRRHPDRIINELVSSYWTAWSYDVANKNGIKNLIGKCHNCDKVLEYERLDKIKEIKESE